GNLWRTAELLMGLHNRHTLDQYQLSPSARGVLAVVEGAGEPLEPSVIAERLVVTTGSMTSLLDNLEKRGLVRRLPHPSDRRKLLIDITPEAQAIVDEFLPALHARERDVVGAALTATVGTPEFRHYFFEFGPHCTVAFFEYADVTIEPFAKPAGVADPRAPQFDHLALNLPDENALHDLQQRLTSADCDVTDIIDHG